MQVPYQPCPPTARREIPDGFLVGSDNEGMTDHETASAIVGAGAFRDAGSMRSPGSATSTGNSPAARDNAFPFVVAP
jgi:hypothetical protein